MQPGYPGQDPYQNQQNPNQNPSDPFGQPGYGQPSYQQDPYQQQPYPAQPQPYTDPYAAPQPQYPQYGQPDYTQYGQPPPVAPSSGQPNSGQPYSGAPYADPYGQQPYSAQPYSGQPYSGQPYAAMPQQGYQVPYAQPGYLPAGPGGPRPSNTLGLLSMIFGIIAIPFGFCCGVVGIGAGGAAIVMGILGLRKANQGLATNRGQALAGVICGALGVIGWIVWLAIYAKSGVFNFNTTTDY
jgi:hypothetical protein